MAKLKHTLGDSKPDGQKSFSWSDLTKNPARKAMTIGIVLVVLNQFSGFFAMLNYTGSIFKEAGSSFSPNTSAIIVAVIQIVGTYIASLFVDRAGRKVIINIFAYYLVDATKFFFYLF